MLKLRCLILICVLILLANAAPLDKDNEATVLEKEYTIDEKGNYRFSFATSNGITREESGKIVNVGQPNEHISVIGRYSYYNTEGQREMVEYSADENGYSILPPRPEGTVIASLPASAVASLLGK